MARKYQKIGKRVRVHDVRVLDVGWLPNLPVVVLKVEGADGEERKVLLMEWEVERVCQGCQPECLIDCVGRVRLDGRWVERMEVLQ